MKKITAILLSSLILLSLASCAKKGEGTDTTAQTEENITTAPDTAPVEEETEENEDFIQNSMIFDALGDTSSGYFDYDDEGRPVKWTTNDENSYVTHYEFSYDDEGNLTERRRYLLSLGDDEDLIELDEFVYEDGKIVRTLGYDIKGELYYYSDFEYENSESPTLQTSYSPDGAVINIVENQYNEDGTLIYKTVNILESSTIKEYEYNPENGCIVREKSFSTDPQSGEYYLYSESEYDDNENEISYIVYNTDQTVASTSTHEYTEEGYFSIYTYYNDKGEVESMGKDTYDSLSRHIESVEYDTEGNLLTRIVFEYEGDSEWASKKIVYDSEGNVISEADLTEEFEI